MRLVIQAVLAVAVIALSFLLYKTLTDPQAEYERILAQQAESRARMADIRTAMTTYERREGRYLTTLDSVLMFVRRDSAMVAGGDSVFYANGRAFDADSMLVSPRTGERFELVVNDTSDVSIYVLRDPASSDSIGALEPIPTLRNAASWE